MRTLRLINGWKCRLVEDTSELPDVSQWEEMYLDFETTSFDPDQEAFHAYLGHRIAGAAILDPVSDTAYYVSVRHKFGKNIPVDAFHRWLKTVMKVPRWVNHNINFDAHFANVEGEGCYYEGEMIDTVVEAKLLDSDRFNHRLKPLCRDWCGLPMDEEVRITEYLKGIKSKNYGDLPADLSAEYAAMDVFGNRALKKEIDRRLDSKLDRVLEIEHQFTPVLFRTESRGMRVDVPKAKMAAFKSLHRQIDLQTMISDQTGQEFANSSKHLYDILCTQNGLPVMGYTKKTDAGGGGNPSFDKEAMEKYLFLPAVRENEKLGQLVGWIKELRDLSHFYALYLRTYIELTDKNGFIHPSFNQAVRTGRLSCSRPNLQQANKAAKEFLLPREGYGFWSWDGAQMEFRMIAHYMNDPETIEAYNSGQRVDFHQWVADKSTVPITRTSGKTMNFTIAFGGGKKKCESNLRRDKDVMESVLAELESMDVPDNQRDIVFRRLCARHAEAIYEAYHARFPVKKVSKRAEETCKSLGYVVNLFGRRRNLPFKHSYKAFNSAVQSGTNDHVKDRCNKISPVHNDLVRHRGIEIGCLVHDEVLFEVPIDQYNDQNRILLNEGLSRCSVPVRVPFEWDQGWSTENWKKAKDNGDGYPGAEPLAKTGTSSSAQSAG